MKINESRLRELVKESVKKALNEANNYGWIVDEREAQEAYDFAVEYFGEEKLNEEIVRGLSAKALAESLAFIFRMYDFREWKSKYEEDN